MSCIDSKRDACVWGRRVHEMPLFTRKYFTVSSESRSSLLRDWSRGEMRNEQGDCVLISASVSVCVRWGWCVCVCACFSEVCICSVYIKLHGFESAMWITFLFPPLSLSLFVFSLPLTLVPNLSSALPPSSLFRRRTRTKTNVSVRSTTSPTCSRPVSSWGRSSLAKR